MASSILALPPQLIDHILGFDDSSYLSLPLFCIGNKRLTQLLQQGVTFLDLRNDGEVAVCQMPWFITQLPALRHLIIDRSVSPSKLLNKRIPFVFGDLLPLSNRERTRQITGALPASMESIIYRFVDSTKLFFPDDLNAPRINPGKRFPNLKRLFLDNQTIWTKTALLDLPLSLTSLKITLSHDDASKILDVITHLPSSLLQLAVLSADDHLLSTLPFYDHLPRQLTSLALFMTRTHLNDLNYNHIMNAVTLQKLPRSLTSVFHHRQPMFMRGLRGLDDTLELPFGGGGLSLGPWQEKTGEALPPFIASLIVPYYKDDKLARILSSLPDHVGSLSLRGAPELDVKTLPALPQRLTRLSARIRNFKGLKKELFPSTLRSLEVLTVDRPITSKHLLLLPPLTNGQFEALIAPKDFAAFPRSLIRLKLQMNDLDAENGPLDLPPNLTRFECAGHTPATLLYVKNAKGKIETQKAVINDLPPVETASLKRGFRLSWLPNRFLRTIILMGFPIPCSDLIHLPEALTFLTIEPIFHDSLFSTSNKELMARAAELIENLDIENCLSGEHPQLSICDLLPRNLYHLSLTGHLASTLPSCWARMPQNIEHLSLWPSDPFDQEILSYLPMTKLRGLTLYLRHINEAHFLLIPPRLRWFDLRTVNMPLPISESWEINDNTFALPPNFLSPQYQDYLTVKRADIAAELIE